MATVKVISGSKVKILNGSKIKVIVDNFVDNSVYSFNLYGYTNNASITGMVIDFSSFADVNIFNDTFTLNETITSNQPLNFTL